MYNKAGILKGRLIMLLKNKNSLEKTQELSRNSGIEMLKVIAILLICMSHCVQTLEKYADFAVCVEDPQLLILKILRFDGNFGNVIFIICSCYFLLKSSKAKKEKAVGLLLDSQIISIVIFALLSTLGALMSFEIKYNFEYVINQLFPDLFEQVWFVPTYVAFYLIHPYLNEFISKIGRKKHFEICLLIVIFYGILSLFKAFPLYSKFLGFVCVYFLIAYMKFYYGDFMKNRKKNILIFFVSLIAFLGIVIANNYIGLKFSFFENYPNVSHMLCIVTLPMFISLFNLALNSSFKSKFINSLSSCSLFVYCIHENYIVRMVIRPAIYEAFIDAYGENKLLVYALVLFVFVVVSSFIAAKIYKKTLHKLTVRLSVKLTSALSSLFNKIYLHTLSEKSVCDNNI